MSDEDSAKIYENYKDVVARTHIEAQIGKPGQPYTPRIIIPEDFELRKQLHKELKENHMSWLKENLDSVAMWDFEQDPF